jgi:hypothetical protein
MGRQINFYWHGEDETEFLTMVRAAGGVLLSYFSPTNAPNPITAVPNRNVPGWFRLVLWNASKCSAPRITSTDKPTVFAVDTTRSEVIELSRSFERDGVLERGRIWAEINLWPSSPNEPVIEKSASFISWYRSLERWIRSHYEKSPGGNYVAPGAAAFVASGGILRSR